MIAQWEDYTYYFHNLEQMEKFWGKQIYQTEIRNGKSK